MKFVRKTENILYSFSEFLCENRNTALLFLLLFVCGGVCGLFLSKTSQEYLVLYDKMFLMTLGKKSAYLSNTLCFLSVTFVVTIPLSLDKRLNNAKVCLCALCGIDFGKMCVVAFAISVKCVVYALISCLSTAVLLCIVVLTSYLKTAEIHCAKAMRLDLRDVASVSDLPLALFAAVVCWKLLSHFIIISILFSSF